MRQQQSRNKEKLPRQEKNQPKKNKMYVWENDYTQIFRQKKSIFILSHVLLSYSHKVTMHETHETESYRMSLYLKISETIKANILFCSRASFGTKVQIFRVIKDTNVQIVIIHF